MTKKQVPFFERMRNSFEYRTGYRFKRHFPESAEELEQSDLYQQWWYYSVELLPGLVTKGFFPPALPLLPRLMLRRCDLTGMSCLDLGSMEGLIPALMVRAGAREVIATDAVTHCLEKLEAVKHYYQVDFDYKTVGLMYNLDEKLKGHGFDFINCSGLLYHVFSPLMVLCSIRPLLKRNGLIVVSTNVVKEDGYYMEFNNGGRLQDESNSFWYISVKLFDYLLRYLKLAPIDCLFQPHESVRSDVRYVFDKSSGYLSVLCRATDEALPTPDDEWMAKSTRESWEYRWIPDWKRAERQALSSIRYKGQLKRQFFRQEIECLDLWEATNQSAFQVSDAQPSDSHILRLSDML